MNLNRIFKKEEDGSKQLELDKRLVFSSSKSKVPSLKQVKYIKQYLNKKESWVLGVSFFVLSVSLIFLGLRFYFTNLQVVPARGGEYVEGLIGAPKYINPLYSSYSDVDSDISSLIFSSILKRNKEGELVNDLATNYEVSEDGKIYTFKIRNDVKFHNDTLLTIEDIVFTFNIIKDSRYNSPLEKSFIGVEIEKINEETIRFLLAEPYAAFLELLTFGILPQDLWYQVTPSSAGLHDLNLRPIGSGPYKPRSLVKDKTGQIKSYDLTVFDGYYGQPSSIEEISFVFFPNFEEAVGALNGGSIDGISYLPRHLKESLAAQDSLIIHNLNMPQLTAIFFNNQNNDSLSDKSVRQALAIAINKNEIIQDKLGGNARIIDGPILPNNFAYNNKKKYNYNKEEAEKILDDAGWKIVEITEDDIKDIKEVEVVEEASDDSESAEEQKEERSDEDVKKDAEKIKMGAGRWRQKDDVYLSIKITAVEADENYEIANQVKIFWEEIGIKTEVELIQASQMRIDVIQPRNFEALFYSQMLGADPDLYVFWHSSQVGESGLNLSNYANKDIDQLLEDARISTDVEVRKEKYKIFQETITEDLPAIFLYSPTYTYVQSKKVKGFDTKSILIPHNRFANIIDWYVKTGKKLVW